MKKNNRTSIMSLIFVEHRLPNSIYRFIDKKYIKSLMLFLFKISCIMLISVYAGVLFRSTSFKFLQMAGKHKITAMIMIIECIFNIILSIILVHIMGTVGVAIGTLLPNAIISIFVVFPLFSRFSGLSVISFCKNVYFPAFIIAIPAICFLILCNYLVLPYKANIFTLGVFSTAAGMIYIILGYFFYFNDEEINKYAGMLPIAFLRKLLIR